MVTKRVATMPRVLNSSVLAKINMVTKLDQRTNSRQRSSVLAKINMVTKLKSTISLSSLCSVLAKINMVTKPQKYGSTFLNVIEY